jgi:hypothetical protein
MQHEEEEEEEDLFATDIQRLFSTLSVLANYTIHDPDYSIIYRARPEYEIQEPK